MLFIFALALIVFLYRRKKNEAKQRFLFLVPLMMFGVITMVFLITENYKRVLDQTTVNRVFTVIFIVFAFYLGQLLFDEHKELKN
jgi:amino acid transporter